MPAPKGHKYLVGNKGGGRMGYTYEKDQLTKLRQIIDRALFKMEAIEKGKVSDKEVEKFKVMLPVILKAMDKLHPNKMQTDIQVEIKPIPILAKVINAIPIYDSDQQNKQIGQENTSDTGGN